jgi:3-deoxy-D-manno-octulosonic acid kinase
MNAITFPQGFERIAAEGRLRLVVRQDVRDVLVPLLVAWARGTALPGRPLPGGRGGVRAYDLGGRLAVVLRPYRRGGLVARLNSDVYCGVRSRPARELAVTESLRVLGVPTVEMLAAATRWLVPGCYRGAVVSREVADAVNLWEYLQRVEAPERARACAATAAVTRLLHDRGAVHPDLNLQNYLIRRRGADLDVRIIDCDGVRLGRVGARDRQAAFDRLCRSIRRLDPASAIVTLGCVEALRAVAEP